MSLELDMDKDFSLSVLRYNKYDANHNDNWLKEPEFTPTVSYEVKTILITLRIQDVPRSFR